MKKLNKSLEALFNEQASDMGITKGTPRYVSGKHLFMFGVVVGKAGVRKVKSK